jgi:hypothetical protein
MLNSSKGDFQDRQPQISKKNSAAEISMKFVGNKSWSETVDPNEHSWEFQSVNRRYIQNKPATPEPTGGDVRRFFSIAVRDTIRTSGSSNR